MKFSGSANSALSGLNVKVSSGISIGSIGFYDDRYALGADGRGTALHALYHTLWPGGEEQVCRIMK